MRKEEDRCLVESQKPFDGFDLQPNLDFKLDPKFLEISQLFSNMDAETASPSKSTIMAPSNQIGSFRRKSLANEENTLLGISFFPKDQKVISATGAVTEVGTDIGMTQFMNEVNWAGISLTVKEQVSGNSRQSKGGLLGTNAFAKSLPHADQKIQNSIESRHNNDSTNYRNAPINIVSSKKPLFKSDVTASDISVTKIKNQEIFKSRVSKDESKRQSIKVLPQEGSFFLSFAKKLYCC